MPNRVVLENLTLNQANRFSKFDRVLLLKDMTWQTAEDILYSGFFRLRATFYTVNPSDFGDAPYRFA